MKTFFTILSVLLVTSCQTFRSESQGNSFLSAQALHLIEKASLIKVTNEKAMLLTPQRISPDDPKNGRALTPQEKTRLLEFLKKAPDLNPSTRLPSCTFQPGARFTFIDDSKTPEGIAHYTVLLTILLCFNCDVWAVGGQSLHYFTQSSDNIVAFGDSRPWRADLLKFKEELLNK